MIREINRFYGIESVESANAKSFGASVTSLSGVVSGNADSGERRRDSALTVIGGGRGGSGSRALAIPMGAKFISSDINLGDDLDDELNLLDAPDTLDEIIDDESDLRTLKVVYERNPQVFAKFIVEIGLEVVRR